MEVPVYELKVSEDLNSDLQVDYVAGVDKPAIESNFMAFNEEKNLFNFAQIQDEQRIVFGAAMIPDQLILRKDEKTGLPFKVFYTAKTIQTIAEKFFANGYQNNFNLMHDPNQRMEGVIFFQSVIKDSSKGIEGVKDELPNGTWYLGAKVNNDEVWQRIKAGEIKGFSIEGYFTKVPVTEPMYTAEEAHRMIEEILNRTQLN
jgi:hypothetical protein